MNVSTPTNRSAENAASLADQGGTRTADQYGSVFFEVVMPSRIVDPERSQIRDRFNQVVQKLTGLNTGPPLGGLCAFMFDELTGPGDDEMPSHGQGMEDALNDPGGYLERIATSTYIGVGATIGQYKAVLDTTGVDLYCIGTDGLRYCYHYFVLTPKPGSSVGPILMPEEAKFRICCGMKF